MWPYVATNSLILEMRFGHSLSLSPPLLSPPPGYETTVQRDRTMMPAQDYWGGTLLPFVPHHPVNPTSLHIWCGCRRTRRCGGGTESVRLLSVSLKCPGCTTLCLPRGAFQTLIRL